MDYKFLGKDTTPEFLKSLKPEERKQLCEELRDKILNTVSSNGGHLASNLGAIELTVALLSVFDYKQDKDRKVRQIQYIKAEGRHLGIPEDHGVSL